MELTSIQKTKVEEIIDHFSINRYHKVNFKAPTGSGKTLMATYFISSIMDRFQDERFIFVIATPSSSSLPFFFEQKINLYKKDLPYSKFEVEYIESPSVNKSDKSESTVKLIPQQNKVYIFGKATFGKGRIFTEQGVIDDFVQNALDHDLKLIYIRDEAHIGGRFANDEVTKHFEALMQTSAYFSLNMTATPDLRDDSILVEIKESELNNPNLNEGKWLLKTQLIPLLDKDILDDDLLEDAITKFKRIKAEYSGLSYNIKPAMLIQVDNDASSTEKNKAFNEALKKVKESLNRSGLTWFQYFGKSDTDSNKVNRYSLEDITQSSNEVDVIIFKIGPSTGWDIPRACVLLQLRNVSSESLSIQTLGRIKRNPYPKLEKNSITDKYYIYSNANNASKDLEVFTYDVKSEFQKSELVVVKITNKDELDASFDNPKILNMVKDFLQKNRSQIIQSVRDAFVKNEKGIGVYRINRTTAFGHVIYSEITSPFILLKDLERIMLKKTRIVSAISGVCKSFYDNQLSDVRIYDDILLTMDHLMIVLLTTYLSELETIIRKGTNFVPKYAVETVVYEPTRFVQLYSEAPLTSSLDDQDSYFFKIKKNNKEESIQPLDSRAEEFAFGRLSRELYKFEDSVCLWCKNQTTSNIYTEYIDNENSLRSSFFDFIVKFKNDVHMYIEVKSDKDINSTKTSTLRRAYKEYFDRSNTSLFREKLVLSIWVVSDDGQIKHETYYSSEYFTNNFNELTIKEMISTLASFGN